MEVTGFFDKNKRDIFINDKKVNEDLFVFIKGKIFNILKIANKNKIHSNKPEQIVATLYKKKKLSFLKSLDGSFSLVIYDKKEDLLFLIKDKLGNEPIYYYHQNNTLMFSTSLKKIMKIKEFPKEINKQALANYLGYMYIYEPLTIFNNTYKVEKGSYIIYNGTKINKKNYFSLWDEYEKRRLNKISEEQIVNDFSKTFKTNIEKYGKKTSQVGVLMSSGKDSTFLAKLANDYYTKKINTYTLGFENEKDESKDAQEFANFIGSNHHTIILKEKEVVKTIKKVSSYYDEPFADPSIIPSIYLIENIKDKNDFFLTGDGNDALFLNSKMYDIYNCYPRIKLFLRKLQNINIKRRYYKNFSEMAQTNIIRRFNYSDKLVGLKGQVFLLRREDEKIRSASLGDLTNTVAEKYRVKTNTLMNHYDWNLYTPFYDPEVILKTFSVPTKMMNRYGSGKILFDKILYQSIPQKYFVNYKKKGFGIPTEDWVLRLMLPEIKKISSKDFIEKQKLFSYEELNKLIATFEKDATYGKAIVLWCYYVFQLWYNQNIGN